MFFTNEAARSAGMRACVIASVFFAFMAVSERVHASQLEAATSFLLQSQRSDGAIAGSADIATAEQATAAALAALEPNASVDAPALAFLESTPLDSRPTEYLVRLLIALGGSHAPALEALQKRQNMDGGFGSRIATASSLLDTAHALRALVAANLGATSSAQRAVTYLLAAHSSGQWVANASSGDAALSLQIWHALYPFRHENAGVIDVLDAVLAQWSAPFAEDFMEAQRLQAVMLRASSAASYESDLQAFASRRSTDGSFSADVYSTALALQALKRGEMPFPNPDLASINGRVIDAEYGAVLSGATVMLGSGVTATTDAAGRFHIGGVEAGTVSLRITSEGYNELVADIQLARGQSLDLGDLGLLNVNASGSLLRGMVTDAATGAALANATVSLGDGRETVTGGDGQFAFRGLDAGAIDISVSATGYEPARRSVDIGTNTAHLVNIALQLAGSGRFNVAGTVTDAETAQPLANVVVSVEGDYSASTVTDANGHYAMSGLPTGFVTLRASKAGYSSADAATDVADGHSLNFSPTLYPEGSPDAAPTQGGVVGAVHDLVSSEPVADAIVTLNSGSTSQSVTTDGSGSFEFQAEEGEYELTISAAGYRPTARYVSFINGLVRDYGTISLSPDGYYPSITLSGVILDSASSAPLPGTMISVIHDDGQVATQAEADGVFSVNVDGDREVVIQATAEGYGRQEWSMRMPTVNLDMGQLRLRANDLVSLQPDLYFADITTANRHTNPVTLSVDGTIGVVVANGGRRIASIGVDIVAFADSNSNAQFDDGEDVELGRLQIPAALDIGESKHLDIAVSGALPYRDAPIALSIDPGNGLLEASEQNNFATTAQACRAAPAIGVLNPVEKFRWTGSGVYSAHNQVMSTPMVAPLFDTNDNGVIDDGDERAIVFLAFAGRNYQQEGIVRAISGIDGRELWTAGGYLPRPDPAGQLAIGDIDNDGFVEIIAPMPLGLMVLEHDGQLKWKNTRLETGRWNSPAIADLNADGRPEIIYGPFVLDAHGKVLWRTQYVGGVSYGSYAMDLDGDGLQEVIAGASVYEANGRLRWKNTAVGDGWTATADFDGNGSPEIVHVGFGRVSMLTAGGERLWGPVYLPGGGNGGPPTIADMDGDGAVEIGVAGSSRYTVLRGDGSILWTSRVQDYSSNTTGSSVFDFEADGKAEVVYADETTLWIFSGQDGTVLEEIPHSSGTTHEVPVVADVDLDGRAEIVVCANQFFDSAGINGIRVFEGAEDNWARTRAIWNQQSYSINNVGDDGGIPVKPETNWSTHNTFRLNTRPGEALLASADLTVALFQLHENGPSVAPSATMRIGNAGELSASNFSVSIYSSDPGEGGQKLVTETVSSIPAGSFIDLTIDFPGRLVDPTSLYVVVNEDGQTPECFIQNNVMSLSAVPTLGDVTVTTDAPVHAPESDAGLVAVVENTGSFARAFEAQLRIEDAAGDIVAELPRQALGELASGEQRIVQDTWNTGRYLAGDYRLRGVLYAADGELLASDTTGFAIAHDATTSPLAALRLSTDRARYHTTDQVRIDLLAQNQSVSTLLGASTVHATVVGPAGQVVFDQVLNVRELGAGNNAALSTVQLLNAVATGDYAVTAAWRDNGGNLLAAAERNYGVYEDLAKALQGSVTVSMPELYVGESLTCTERVANAGTQSAAVNLRRTLARLDAPSAQTAEPFAVTLPAGDQQTWLRGVDTAGMQEGDYACVLEAEIDASWQPLASAFFRLLPPPIRIDASMNGGDRGRLLVLLDPACADLEPAQADGAACDADPHGPGNAPPLPIQREHLEAVLEAAGWTFTIVTDAESFAAEFASRGYEVFALFNEQLKLPEALQRDVVADIAKGRGLLVSGNHDRRNGRLEDALGLRSLGKNLDVEKLLVQPFGEHDGGEFAFLIAQAPNAVRLEGADVLGEYSLQAKGNKSPSPQAALTRNAHGEGTGVYAGFDLPVQSATEGDDGQFAGLLTATLDVAHPQPYGPVAGRTFPLRIVLTNEGMATPGQVHLRLPQGVGLVQGPPGTTVNDDIAAWSFALAEEQQRVFTAWLRLPQDAGPLAVEAVIHAGEGDSLAEHTRTATVFNVQVEE